SFLTPSTAYGDSLVLRAELYGWNTLGERKSWSTSVRRVPYRPYLTQALAPLPVTMPNEPAVAVLATRLEDAAGTVLQRHGATFLVEASAKRLNGKDRDSTMKQSGDYMRGGGFHDPSANPNSYPMTGTTPYPSAVTVRVNGELAGRWELTDDPADSRGVLSW